MATVRRAKKKGWFRRCVDAVNREGSAYDPEAVCGALVKKKRAAGYVPARERAAARRRVARRGGR